MEVGMEMEVVEGVDNVIKNTFNINHGNTPSNGNVNHENVPSNGNTPSNGNIPSDENVLLNSDEQLDALILQLSTQMDGLLKLIR